MTTYLLLRDNKESGPYSFDELKQKGLKAYDLVWLEGKSAAWRYPSELEELKPFAPAVEEQPFDRFYKRPFQENSSRTPAVQSSAPSTPIKQLTETETPVRISVSGSSVFSGEPSAVSGKRIIYVTLPAGKGTPVTREITPRETVKAPPAVQDRLISSSYEPTPAVSAALFEAKSAQTGEDRNAGVEVIPRGSRRQDLSGIFQPVAVVVCVLALLAAGIFIGLSINKDKLGFQKIAAKNEGTNPAFTKPPANDPPVKVQQVPVTPAAPALQVPVTDTVNTAILADASIPHVKKPVGSKDRLSLPAQKTPSTLSSPVKDSAFANLPVIHREASHRADPPVEKIDKDVVRNNLSNLVSVGANGYTVGTFGGISGIQLTVSNKSVYPLDLVMVEVQYVQANKKVFKTENLNFRNIGPGSALMLEAPNSSRGIKVQYKITLINSKELGLAYSTL